MALIVLAGLLVGTSAGTTAKADTTPTGQVAAVKPAATLIAGSVRAGTSTRANVPVVVVAWPSDDVLSQQGPGSKGELKLVAKGTSGVDGSFSIPTSSVADLRPFATRSSGMVNLEVMALGPGSDGASFSFSRRVGASGQVLADPSGAAATTRTTDDALLSLDPAVASGPTTATQNFIDGTWYYTWIKDFDPVWDLVGQLYINTSGASGTFTYTNGASSEIGVGVSVTGAYGTWSPSGTASKSSTITIIYPTVTTYQGRYFDTEFRHSEFSVAPCWPPGCTVMRYAARVTAFVGGSRVRSVSAPAAPYCVPEAAGSTTIITTSKAVQWSDGLAIGGQLGIALSTRTGYSTSASLSFTFTAAHRLCGTNGLLGSYPAQLVAEP